MFRTYGYEYLFGADVAWIREVLNATETPKELDYPVFHASGDDAKRSLFTTGIARINSKLRSFIVSLPAPPQQSDAVYVFLPGLGEEGREMYAQLRIATNQKHVVEYVWGSDEPAKRLAKPEYAGFAHRQWWRAFS